MCDWRNNVSQNVRPISTLGGTNENFVCLPHNLNYDAPLVDRVLEGTTVVT